METETPAPTIDAGQGDVVETGTIGTTEDAEPTSLSDHEAQFHAPEGAEPDEPTTTPTKAAGETPEGKEKSAPARDPESGQFIRGQRHRAKSQQAGADDVPRIRELTQRLRQTEAERDQWRGRAEAPIARTAQPAPGRPDPNDEKKYPYGTVDPQFIEDLASWIADQKLSARDAADQKRRDESAQKTAQEELRSSWQGRVQDARDTYEDFDDVALMQETRIPEGSLTDHWIKEHDAGAHVLYYLQRNPDELDELLALSPLKQVEALSLLSQRWTSSSSQAADSTGAAPRAVAKNTPKPPTPVRTGPTRPTETVADGSLRDHEARHYPNGMKRAR